MHVRVTRGRFDPSRLEEVQPLMSKVGQALKTFPGFVSYQGGLDPQAGTLVAISTWEDEQSANFQREALGELIGRILEVSELEPAEIWEVVVTA